MAQKNPQQRALKRLRQEMASEGMAKKDWDVAPYHPEGLQREPPPAPWRPGGVHPEDETVLDTGVAIVPSDNPKSKWTKGPEIAGQGSWSDRINWEARNWFADPERQMLFHTLEEKGVPQSTLMDFALAADMGDPNAQGELDVLTGGIPVTPEQAYAYGDIQIRLDQLAADPQAIEMANAMAVHPGDFMVEILSEKGREESDRWDAMFETTEKAMKPAPQAASKMQELSELIGTKGQ